MNALYQSMIASFECRIADLRPRDAYSSVSTIAHTLANKGFESLSPAEVAPDLDSGPSRFRPQLCGRLERGYAFYANRDLEKALSLADVVHDVAVAEGDRLSEIDALHLRGRIRYDLDQPEDAAHCFAEEMNRAQQMSCAPGFVRAIHELSRVHAQRYDLLAAECGFRLALDFYLASFTITGWSHPGAARSDQENVAAAMKCLRALSRAYILVAEGPKEGDALLARLRSPFLSTRDGTGDAFLELRGLAAMIPASFPNCQAIIGRMLSKAMGLYEAHPRVSVACVHEAEFAGDLTGDCLPYAVHSVLTRSAHSRAIRRESVLKAGVDVVPPCAPPHPFSRPESPASSPAALYFYLAKEDRGGRYVYRGQTADFPGPLLPSAFRPILTTANGCVATDSSDPRFAECGLRRCGRRFVGEYNSCFRQYADPVSHLVQDGAPVWKVQASFELFRKILDGTSIPMAQEGADYVPWIDALRRCLSVDERSLFQENQDHWMVLINSYHRRQYRMDRLVDLFDYTLGTTIAQQYGLWSEGLDATKSLDVALFFATRDSSDFRTVKSSGIGVVYRFPFPVNDVACSELRRYNYYTLPSVLDVEDVVRRCEMEHLGRDESRRCLDAYIGAHFIDGLQNPDLLCLPEGFYEYTRIGRQQAVIVLPDEIREDYADRKAGVGGIVFPKYRFIEDLAAREGVEKFYFRHTGNLPDEAESTTRECLWPRDDAMLETVVRIILGRYRMRMLQAKRLDLVDVGFDQEQFAAEASKRYWAERPIFYSEQELLAASHGALVM